jgi:hypothetical protein
VKRAIAVTIALMLAGCDDEPAGSPASGGAAPEPWPMEWSYQEGSCQHTETRVLVANAANLITWADPEACEVAAGSWQSWGRDVQLPLHLIWVVPLVTPTHAEMHGAADWSRDQKQAFINDKDNLIILDRVSASERGDLNPEAWTPLPRYWCEYARRWQRVKQRYQLHSGEEEQKALAKMLASCPAAESPGS